MRLLNYFEHLLILASTVTRYLFSSALASLAGTPVGILSSTVGLKICATTAIIKKYKSLIKKKRRNMIKWYAKTKLNTVKALDYKALFTHVYS